MKKKKILKKTPLIRISIHACTIVQRDRQNCYSRQTNFSDNPVHRNNIDRQRIGKFRIYSSTTECRIVTWRDVKNTSTSRVLCAFSPVLCRRDFSTSKCHLPDDAVFRRRKVSGFAFVPTLWENYRVKTWRNLFPGD